MKFKANTRRKAIDYEKDLVAFWRDNKIFEKSVEQRPAADSYVFYDGPPFITGVPHAGTLLSSIIKDAVPRYWTMKGKRVERVWGWDCHGLPAEVFTEKKLGIHDKRDIGTKISLEDYIKACRDNMIQTGNEWEDTIARVGRWVDFKGAYKTMDKNYMESVWWAFQKLYNEGKIYEGEKVLLYCTRDATPVSKAEIAMDNSYQDVTDPSVYVKFKLTDEDTYLLAWTTTPWTLPANTAVAVNHGLEYSEVEVDGQKFILAKDLISKVLTDEKHNVVPYTIIKSFKGEKLVGRSYEPLFENRGKNAHKVWSAPYITTEEGTGIVHLAPAYGEEDYALAKENNFPIISNIDDNGLYDSGQWAGQQVWEVNKQIAKELYEKGIVWKIEYIRHSYPHCHRCGNRLMYRAHPSWFMNVKDQQQQMLEENGNINWFPAHFKEGRFAKNIQQAPDWNMSRDRFWATAIPVWKGKDADGKEYIKIVGSYQELKDLSGVELEDYHRPWIDEVTFEIDGIKYQRIDKVLDSWFEAGSMPFAQFHYPFENQEKFEQNFPGDFIAEYVAQTRAWFYYLHALSVGLFGKNAFKNVIVTGTLAGNDGRKMSKSFGNYTDPNELMDLYSADAFRLLLLSSPVLNAEDFSLQDKDVSDINRKLAMIWNMYDFFTLYASVDGWEWNGNLDDPYQELTNSLDQWIVSRIHQLTEEVDQHMQGYDLPNAMAAILPFVDDASNWYVRRSRKRFWKSDNDSDKNDAYRTLHYILVRLSLIMAPFTPFLAEELYKKLTGGESVHLQDWPAAGQVNGILIKQMHDLRELITEGLAQRASASIKVRQPLSSLRASKHYDFSEELNEILKEEVNVKEVKFESGQTKLDTKITNELKQEGQARELIRFIQNARKQAGLQVDDRIRLNLQTDDQEIVKTIDVHKSTILAETLGVELHENGENMLHQETVKLDGAEVHIKLAKA
ncbi:MAG: isoleucine--tRNA ligase [Candidatus Saccharimonadales bacterium]